MHVLWGIVILGLALLAWGGQLLSSLAPATAVRWGLMEGEDAVEPVYWADIRGEAAWDVVSLWPMVVAGALLAADHSVWAYFGLVGGGAFLYFAGRGIVTRLVMVRSGFRIGTPENVRSAFVFLTIWAVMAVVVIAAAANSLST